MDNVIAALLQNKPHEALIRLWVLAESTTVEDFSQATLWQQSPPPEIDISKWLAAPTEAQAPQAAASPLQLLGALDKHLADIDRHHFQKVPSTEVIDGTTYALIRRRHPRPARALEQEPNLSAWCRHHSLIPLEIALEGKRITVRIEPYTQVPSNKFQASEIRCRLSHYKDQVVLQITETPDSRPAAFHATGLSDEPTRNLSLLAELAACRADGAHLWVAPELTAPDTLQTRISQAMASDPVNDLLLAVPGSFHQTVDGYRHNIARIFSGQGSELPSHYKLTQFSYPKDSSAVHEDIVNRRRITLFDTPIGLIGVAICKDFSDQSDAMLAYAWRRIAPDWILVPSYGDEDKTCKLHKRQAEEHWCLRNTRSLVANQELLYQVPGEDPIHAKPTPGFVCGEGGVQPAAEGGSTLTLNPIAPDTPPKPRLQRVK